MTTNEPKPGFKHTLAEASETTLARLTSLQQQKEEIPVTTSEALATIRKEARITSIWESACKEANTKDPRFSRLFVEDCLTGIPEFLSATLKCALLKVSVELSLVVPFEIIGANSADQFHLRFLCYDYEQQQMETRLKATFCDSIPQIIGRVISRIENDFEADSEVSERDLANVFNDTLFNLELKGEPPFFEHPSVDLSAWSKLAAQAIVEASEGMPTKDSTESNLLRMSIQLTGLSVMMNQITWSASQALLLGMEFESFPDFSSIRNRLLVEGVKLDYASERNMVAAQLRQFRKEHKVTGSASTFIDEFLDFLGDDAVEFGYSAEDALYLTGATNKHRSFLLKYFGNS